MLEGYRCCENARPSACLEVSDPAMQQNGFVHATLNYTADNGTAPEVYFYEPPQGTPVRPPGDDPREMQIFDGWSRANSFSLDREGFELWEFENTFEQFDDAEAVRTEFYAPVAQFVRDSVGARRVVVFDHTIRSKLNAERQTAEHSTVQRAPVMSCTAITLPHPAPCVCGS